MFKGMTLAAMAAAVLVSGVAVAQGDVIKARRDGFDSGKKAMEAIKKTLEGGEPVAGVGAYAQAMGNFATTIPALFPAGSDKGDTKAKPEIWTDFKDFTAKANDMVTAAKKLEEAAATGDKAATMKQFAALGGTCKACHDSYRAK